MLPISGDSRKRVTVKIHITGDNENVLAVNFDEAKQVTHLKEDIAKKFKICPKNILVFQNGDEICDEHILCNLNLNDFGIIEIDMRLQDEAIAKGIKLETNTYYSSFTLPDIITVHIPTENENEESMSRDLVVEIENKCIKKPFLGGYINKKTNIEYHHAFTQTGPAIETIQKIREVKLCRDTQTIDQRRRAIDTNNDRSTQNFGDANVILFSEYGNDYCVDSHIHENYEEALKRRNLLGKVKLIQRTFRRYRLQCCIKQCAAEYRRLVTIKEKREDKIKQDFIYSHQKSCDFPRSKKDFDILFAQITSWKENETKRVTEQFTGPARVIEIQNLLEKEIQLLNGIERRRHELQKEMQKARQDRILQKYSTTVKWIGYKNTLIEMDTLKTQRARKLAEYFKRLRHPSENIDDRLKLLNKISEALRDENSKSIVELEKLFEREKELLWCKLNEDTLYFLRERQLIVFLDVIKDEENCKQEKPLCRVCEKCRSVQPMKNFVMHAKQRDYDICHKCLSLKSSKTDLSVYRSILRSIQREERRRNSMSSLAFIMQETDVKYIIENIFHGISSLSQCDIIKELRLPRWNVQQEWSPWNCICLTLSEARIHVDCTNVEEIYGVKIMKDILSKHSLAKSIFKQLKSMNQSLVETGDWNEIGIKDKTVGI